MNDSPQRREIEDLRHRLEEAESTLSAIRNGEVDALVIGGKEIYTLEGADHPYRVLVEAMQQGAVTLSQTGSIVYCNLGFAHMVRRTAEQIIGEPIESFFAAEDQPNLQARLLADHATKQLELSLKTDEGLRLPVLVSFNRLALDGAMALCLVIADLTEHNENKSLHDTDRRKDEFLAMLAHELRNPLAPIANAIQMLCLGQTQQDETVRLACEIVDRQVKNLTRIVDDLLDVSRIIRGKIKLQTAVVDLSSVLAAAVETSRPLIEFRQHRLHIALPPDPLPVEVDFTRMAQVITNLLNNAAKYTEEGGDIELSAERVSDRATITVRDNGVGLAPDVLPKVFEIFTQADRTIDRSQGGLGIGLTIVRTLVELHHGSVSVSSGGLGRGSEFIVSLPLAAPPRGGAAQPNADQAAFRPAATSHRILVVDDNSDSALSLTMALKAMGHQCAVAHDGQSAIDKARLFKPKLILLDIGLPGMSGYAVAQAIRATPELRGIVLAALTGYGDEQYRRRSREAGFDKHFVKPISFAALRDLIATLSPGETRPS
jgi:PAS domain S-box-containing protein